MSGGRFPFIMALLGLIDAVLGLAFFLLKAMFWLMLVGAILVLVL